MPDYADAKHRPHAVHTGEEPQLGIDVGPHGLKVTLDTWGPKENLFPAMYDALQSNWGEHPSRTVNHFCPWEATHVDAAHFASWEHQTGACKLNPNTEWPYVVNCFAGKTLQQVLERITFSFLIDGVTRACTHEYVRVRLGAGFMQHGGRDNDWRHRRWTMPETLARACSAYNAKWSHEAVARSLDAQRVQDDAIEYPTHVNGASVCIEDWAPIERYLDDEGWHGQPGDLQEAVVAYLRQGKRLYAALVDAGIPWQDARRLLHIGTQTYIHGDFNYVAVKGMLANRLEFIMDWEINCVAQLMLREINLKCPPIFGKYLGSHSDRAQQARFAGLESWPPDGKWPVPERDLDLPRMHRPEQMPFWVLHPDSLSGKKPIEWLRTNGTYPHDAIQDRKA